MENIHLSDIPSLKYAVSKGLGLPLTRATMFSVWYFNSANI
jgi:hypothetical protein